MKRTAIVGVVLVLLAAVAIAFREPLWGWGCGVYQAVTGARPAGPQADVSAAAVLVASGAIEAHTILVGSPVAGRLVAVHVAEGDRVAAGAMIAELDTSLIDAQIAQAQAAAAGAAAQVALLQAGARPADIAVARAALKQAQAASAAAYNAWQDAQALVTAPGDLDVKIASASVAAPVAEAQLAAAQAGATAADLEQGLWERTVKLLEEGFDVPLPYPGQPTVHVDARADQMNQARLQWNLSSQRTWQAHAQAGIAGAALDAARQTLADLQAQKSDPQSLQAQADAAGSAYHLAEAAVGIAQANLDVALSGAQAEQVQAAEALLAQAQAGVQTLQVKRGQARISAPEAGSVTSLILHQGEVAAAGSPVIHLADLSQVTLKVYVPEPQLGRVRLGQAVQVMVDSFPGRPFAGTVTQIADQAEFTPKNVQTRDERANTVFAVKIVIPNPDAALKVGMPADAYFCAPEMTDCLASADQTAGALPAIVPRAAGQEITAGPIQASGIVQGTETTLSAELGGRVVAVAAAEGDVVPAGRVLVRLDSSELEARRAQASAAVTAAQADLARVTAAPQPTRVAQVQAQVIQAAAALDAARSALAHAQALRANPQELDAQIKGARAQRQAAVAGIDLARADLKAAQVLQESVPADTGSDQDKTRRAIYDQQVLVAEAALRAAEEQQRGAAAALAQLQAIRAQPVALDAAVHHAEGQVAQAEAALDTTRAALAQVQAPPQPEAVALAQAQVAEAQAGVALLDATVARLQLRAPVTGTITTQMVHAGEVAQPGQALLTLVDLSRVRLVIYVSAGRIGQVRLGQPAQVGVDGYPGRRFVGTVTHIDDQAEFTPKNVQTQEERVKTVFAVEIALENSDGALKPGMPADAVLSLTR